jgi:hypothetical protein
VNWQRLSHAGLFAELLVACRPEDGIENFALPSAKQISPLFSRKYIAAII